MAGVTPALLDPTIDSGHRSFLAKVQHQELNVLRPRPPVELVPVDPRWVPRLSEAGLLTVARLAESALVKLDRSLLSALVDRWRPETHTFHLPCGEMAPTLQDVAMLLGLSITGDCGWRILRNVLQVLPPRLILKISMSTHSRKALPSHGSYSFRYNFIQNDVLMNFMALK